MKRVRVRTCVVDRLGREGDRITMYIIIQMRNTHLSCERSGRVRSQYKFGLMDAFKHQV
eukprot:SAG11_NODE_1937_length_4032_cov_6.541826_5_plen_59_part_00